MKIDMHTHLFSPELLATVTPAFAGGAVPAYGPEETRARAAESGAQAVAILGWPFAAGLLCEAQNRLVEQAMQTLQGPGLALCAAQPAAGEEALREAARCLDAGFAGVGMLDPWGQGFALDDSWFLRLCELCEERGRLLCLRASLSVGQNWPGKSGLLPAEVLRFIESRPGLTLLLPHYGGGLPFYALMPEVAKILGNTWFDTAPEDVPLRPGAQSAADLCLDNGHLLFGSGLPFHSPKAQPGAVCAELPQAWEGLLWRKS